MQLKSSSPLIIAAVFVTSLGTTPVTANENWPGWRNDGSGVSDATNVPTAWSSDENIAWKTPLDGEGVSSPVVHGDHVYITSATEALQGRVLKIGATVAVLLIALVVACSICGGTLGRPLQGILRGGGASFHALGRLVPALLFFAVAFLVVHGLEVLRSFEIPFRVRQMMGASLFKELVDTAEGTRTSKTVYSIQRVFRQHVGESDVAQCSYVVPRDFLVAGFTALFFVLALRQLINARRPANVTVGETAGVLGDTGSGLSASRDEGGRYLKWYLGGALEWVQAAIAAGLAGTFLLAIVVLPLADVPHETFGSWYLAGHVVMLGLAAITAMLSKRSFLRPVMAVIAVASAYALLHYAADHAAIDKRDSPQMASMIQFIKISILIHAWLTIQFMVNLIARRRYRSDLGPKLVGVGTLALIIGFSLITHKLELTVVWDRNVLAFDTHTGDLAWTTVCGDSRSTTDLHSINSRATPTPAIEGDRIYVHFGGVGVFCLTLDGTVVWKADELTPPGHWGAGSSPCIIGQTLVIAYDVDERAMTQALDKRTGEEMWQQDRSDYIELQNDLYDGYSTPVSMTINGQRQVVQNSTSVIVGYDPDSGAELWRHQHPGRQPVASPVIWNDSVIITPGGEKKAYLSAVKVSRTNSTWSAETVWERDKRVPKISAPVIYDNRVYYVTNGGVAWCLDVETGDVIWRSRLSGGNFYASVVAADGHVYFSSTAGVTTVVRAEADEMDVVAENEIDEAIYASMAILDSTIFIRTDQHLYRVGRTGDGPSPQASISPR